MKSYFINIEKMSWRISQKYKSSSGVQNFSLALLKDCTPFFDWCGFREATLSETYSLYRISASASYSSCAVVNDSKISASAPDWQRS